jgi:homocysteine S-methyltransferase
MQLGDGVTVLDGGMATALEARGHDLSDALWSARLLRDDPGAIEAAHLAFYRAGARVAITASYQASYEGFAAVGIDREEATALLARSVALARSARDRHLAEGGADDLLVAASVGPYGAMLAGGQEYTGDYGGVGPSALAAFHRPRIAALLAAGADLIACETIPSAEEAGVLVGVLREFPAARAWISFSCRNGDETCDGTPFDDAVAVASASPNVVAVGINCTAPEHVEALLVRGARTARNPAVVYPNDGRVWDGAARRWRGSGQDGFPAATLTRWRELGASLIGGCCGVGPGGIAAIAARVR